MPTSKITPQLAHLLKGRFIAFEGGEACGKSTQAELLKKELELHGVEVVLTHEPGGCQIGKLIRPILKSAAKPQPGVRSSGLWLDPKAEAVIFMGLRLQHLEETVFPALDRGAVVICDRYMLSTIVYQGVVRQCGATWVQTHLQAMLPEQGEPELTIIFDLNELQIASRMASREASGSVEHANDYDHLALQEHARIAEAYRIHAYGEHCFVDASGTIAEVQRSVLASLEDHYGTLARPPLAS